MHFKFFTLLALLYFGTLTTFSQQIVGKIIDGKTKDAVPFSTIQFDEFNGVISNAEGFYNFSIDNFNDTTVFTVSSLGYLTQNLTLQQLKSKNYTIALDEAINELDPVHITNRLPSVDSIMRRVQARLKQNYNSTLTKHTFFSRQTTFFKPNDVVVEIDKSSGFSKKQLQDANIQLDSLSKRWINSPPSQEFTDILGEFYNLDAAINKFNVTKATKLMDVRNQSSFDNMQKKAAKVILKHLDVNATYKLKTGLFKIEDSLSLKEEKKKQEESVPNLIGVKASANQFLKEHSFGSASLLDFVTDISIYDYSIKDLTYTDGKPVFIIYFEPRKNRAKYTGNLYVSEEDYAVLRVDYKFAKGKKGESINLKLLLGVKYSENVNNGTVIYKKNLDTNFYYPYYINQEIGRYAYVNRPLKFIENGGDKDKIAFDFKVDGNIIEKREVLTFSNEVITQSNYNALTEIKTLEFIKLKQYDPSIWKDYTVLEPLEEMKQFKVIE